MSLFPLASLPLILLCHGGGYGDPGYPNIFNPPIYFCLPRMRTRSALSLNRPSKSYRFCHYALRSLPLFCHVTNLTVTFEYSKKTVQLTLKGTNQKFITQKCSVKTENWMQREESPRSVIECLPVHRNRLRFLFTLQTPRPVSTC